MTNKIDPKRCKADVYTPNGLYHHQCKRKPEKDGWCKQHHPEAVKERERKIEERYSKERYNSSTGRLERMTKERDDLKKKVMAWLGRWRDHMPDEAVCILQEVLK